MIERYSTKEMRFIWGEGHRLELFLKIEDAVIEAMVKTGDCPKSVFNRRKRNIKIDSKRINDIEKITRHDILAFLEFLEEKKYIPSRYLHQGLTSSDILDTATALQMKESLEVLVPIAKALDKTLLSLAKKYKGLSIIGRTHNVYAEPTTLGLRFLNWHSEIHRSLLELIRSIKESAVGKISGAVGNYGNIPPKVEKFVFKKLGIKNELPATQVVARDRFARVICNGAIFVSALERAAVNIRLLHSTEIGEIKEGFSKGQKGSSAMPHKKNPVSSERISGIARLLRGYSVTALENIPLWLERDISHSSNERVILPDSMNLLHFIIKDFTRILTELQVDKVRIKHDLKSAGTFVFSGRLLTELMKKGFSRKKAYETIQKNVFSAKDKNSDLKEIILTKSEITKHFSKKELEKIFDLKDFLKHKDKIFKDYISNLEKLK